MPKPPPPGEPGVATPESSPSGQGINDILNYATVFQRGLDGTILFWNQGCNDMYGWEPEEALGRISHELLQTQFPEPLSSIQNSLLRHGQWQGELRHRHKDGSALVIASKWILRTVPSGVEHVVEINSDITGLAHAEADQARLAAIIASSDAAIISKSLDGIVTSWNQAAEDMFGYRAEEIVGKPITIIASPERPHEMRDILERIRTGERIAHFETERRHKNGKLVPISLSVSPIYDKGGRIIGASKIANDISERVRVTEALKRSEEDLRYFFDLSPQWPWTCGPDGVVGALPEKFASFLGLSVSEAVSGGWRALNHPDDQEQIDRAWARSISTGEPYDQEIRTKLPDGEYRWLRVRAFPRRDATGDIMRWYGVTEDIHTVKVNELALKASEANLRSFFELSPQAPWIGDASGVPTLVSPRYREMVRFLAAGDDRRDWGTLVHPDDFAVVRDAWQVGLASGEIVDSEYRIATPTGQYRWFRTRAYSQKDEGGNVQRWFGVLEDIHDRKMAERALQQSEENLRSFFEFSPQAPWISEPDGTPIEVSPRLAEMGLFSDGKSDPRPLTDVVHLEDYAGIRDAWTACLASGDNLDHEYRVKVSDGSVRWFRMRAFSRKDEGGKVLRWFGVLEDIHERKIAQMALEESEERFRRIYDESPLGIILLRADDLTVVQINPAGAKSIDLPPQEAVGHTFAELLRPSDRFPGGLDDMPVENQWRVVERHYVTKSGKNIAARIRINRLPHIDGQPDMILGMSEDITGQRQAEAALAQAQKMEAVGQLTGGIAHDFNNLLGVIIGNLDMLQSLKEGDDIVEDLAGEAMSGALRGADLVRRLLAFARRQPLQPTTFDVNEAAAGILKMLGRILGENIEITMSPGSTLWPVRADRAQLETALTNLATNARDAMPNGGRLTIATANRHLDRDYAGQYAELSPGDYVMIEVTDSGVGMPPEVLSQIFEPFFTTKETGKGSGLGLSMIFGYAKQSGGHVNVYSEPGVGTTFRLYLPRATAVSGAETPGASFGDMALGSGETILVVEDSAALRRIVVRQIKDLGYRVIEAADGAEALELLKSEAVDLLFTDIVMPGKTDGFALAQAARERWRAVKILLTSGFPETKLSDQLEFAGYRLLSKPYLKTELARLLREVLG